MATKIVALDPNSSACYACGMSPEQCRAARAWLEWSQTRLGETAGVGLSTVKGFEGGKAKPIASTLGAMKAALEKAGIEFVGDGVETASGITYRQPT